MARLAAQAGVKRLVLVHKNPIPQWPIEEDLPRARAAQAAFEQVQFRRVELAGCRMIGAQLLEGEFEDVLFRDVILENAVPAFVRASDDLDPPCR